MPWVLAKPVAELFMLGLVAGYGWAKKKHW